MNWKKDYEEWLNDQLKGKSDVDAMKFLSNKFAKTFGAMDKEKNISNVGKGMMLGSALSSVPFLAINDMHPKFQYIYDDNGNVYIADFVGPSLTYRAAKAVGLGASAAVFIAGTVIFVVGKLNANKERVKKQKLLEKEMEIIKEKENIKE